MEPARNAQPNWTEFLPTFTELEETCVHPPGRNLDDSGPESRFYPISESLFDSTTLRYIPQQVIHLIGVIQKPSTHPQDLPTPPLFVDPPYIALPLQSLGPCLSSSFLQHLAQDRCSAPHCTTSSSGSVNGPDQYLCTRAFPSNHRFWFSVWHLVEWPEFIELPAEGSSTNELQEVALSEIEFLRNFFGEIFSSFEEGSDRYQSINLSLLNNYAIVVHAFQGQDGTKGRSIIAAMMYDCSKDGIWVNWIAVANAIYGKEAFGHAANGCELRRMGFGRLMLGFAQLHNASMGGSTNLHLQVNPLEPALRFYVSLGFQPLPEEELQPAAPTIYQRALASKLNHEGCFVEFQPMEEQRSHAIIRGLDIEDPEVKAGFLRLYVSRKIIWNFGKAAPVKKKPPGNTIYTSYPFNVISGVLNASIGDLIIMGHPCIKHQDDNVFILKSLSSSRTSRPLHGETGHYVRREGRADIYHSTMDRFTSDDRMWMNDELIHFVSTWIFRDSSSVHVRDMEFVNPYVSKAVCDLCQSNVGPVDALTVGSANVVHSYLRSSSTLVWKRFVFFTVNEHNQHWWGMVAVNPWKAILQQTFDKDTFDDEKQYNQVVLSMCGTIIVDGLESDSLNTLWEWSLQCENRKKKDPKNSEDSEDDDDTNDSDDSFLYYRDSDTAQEEDVRAYSDTYPLIWFLNMASLYQDMASLKILGELDPNKIGTRNYWLLGVRGPFGVVATGFHKESELPCYFPVINVPRYMLPQQVDGYNCGLVWLSFVLDFVISQHQSFWVVDRNKEKVGEYIERTYFDSPYQNGSARFNCVPRRRRAGWQNRSIVLGKLFATSQWAELHPQMQSSSKKRTRQDMAKLQSLQAKYFSLFLARFRQEIRACIERLPCLEAIHSRPLELVNPILRQRGFLDMADPELLGHGVLAEGAAVPTKGSTRSKDESNECRSYWDIINEARRTFEEFHQTWFKHEALRECLVSPLSILAPEAASYYGDPPKAARLKMKDAKLPIWIEFCNWLRIEPSENATDELGKSNVGCTVDDGDLGKIFITIDDDDEVDDGDDVESMVVNENDSVSANDENDAKQVPSGNQPLHDEAVRQVNASEKHETDVSSNPSQRLSTTVPTHEPAATHETGADVSSDTVLEDSAVIRGGENTVAAMVDVSQNTAVSSPGRRPRKRESLAPTWSSPRKKPEIDRFINTQESQRKPVRKAKRRTTHDGKALRKVVDIGLFGVVPDEQIPGDARYMADKTGITLGQLHDEIEMNIPTIAAEYPSHETNRDEAVLQFREAMRVRKGQCDQIIQEIGDNTTARAEWEEYKSRSRQLAESEADISQIGNIKEISWVPSTGRSGKLRGDRAGGHYSIRVEFKDGSLKSLEVCSDWVENMFREDIITTVQRIGYEIREKLITRKPEQTKEGQSQDRNVKQGTNFGYVNVESEGKKIMCDTREVNRIRYIPESRVQCDPIFERDHKGRFILDREGNRVKNAVRGTRIIPEKWMGYNNTSNTTFELEGSFVEENFSQGFIAQVKHLGLQKGKGSYVKVPPGDSKRHCVAVGAMETCTAPKGEVNDGIPNIHYRQRLGERTCLVNSFCSALHHMGYRQVASLIYTKRKMIVDRSDTVSRFYNYVSKASSYLMSARVDLTKWNIWNVGRYELVVAQLRGSDGKEDHVVSIADGWLFDSNFVSAMRVTKEALDRCCSSDDSPNDKFVGVVSARVFPGYRQMRRDGTNTSRKARNRYRNK